MRRIKGAVAIWNKPEENYLSCWQPMAQGLIWEFVGSSNWLIGKPQLLKLLVYPIEISFYQ